jgi:23S rRNA (guanine745-N1)-methyltransferase
VFDSTAPSVFACPVCGQPLPRAERVYRCVNAHTFDVARQGYVNLLLAQHRRSKDPGYNKEMIAGRRDFFEAGHYQALADEVAKVIISNLPDGPERVVVDAGCGEGYYLRRLRSLLADGDGEAGAIRCGLDISKHGIRAAARSDPGGLYAVAGSHRMPVLPARVDVLLSHFSPVSAADFRRVVRPGGVVLVGGPGEVHLYSFKELLYDNPAQHEPSDTLAAEPGFEPMTTHRIRYKLALRGPGQVADVLLMTPFFWTVDQATQVRLARLDSLDTEVDVVVNAYRRVRDGETRDSPAPR